MYFLGLQTKSETFDLWTSKEYHRNKVTKCDSIKVGTIRASEEWEEFEEGQERPYNTT